eukprot:CAMPEP_0203018146 /NCGR_PEP_ID=MMETSP1401-20130829/23390_1 /ASSEMBLY_ACC=CAM_ASM_000894 /TAXON_ID=38833 /ORGANISM="Micromonas pusilla, Strain CCAC1681" /LENGTH=147 /DNA_ID=CAMNT_0049759887 /DNA_START=41 /DNA_END=481 /DNA_ORIENTATION=-
MKWLPRVFRERLPESPSPRGVVGERAERRRGDRGAARLLHPPRDHAQVRRAHGHHHAGRARERQNVPRDVSRQPLLHLEPPPVPSHRSLRLGARQRLRRFIRQVRHVHGAVERKQVVLAQRRELQVALEKRRKRRRVFPSRWARRLR